MFTRHIRRRAPGAPLFGSLSSLHGTRSALSGMFEGERCMSPSPGRFSAERDQIFPHLTLVALTHPCRMFINAFTRIVAKLENVSDTA